MYGGGPQKTTSGSQRHGPEIHVAPTSFPSQVQSSTGSYPYISGYADPSSNSHLLDNLLRETNVTQVVATNQQAPPTGSKPNISFPQNSQYQFPQDIRQQLSQNTQQQYLQRTQPFPQSTYQQYPQYISQQFPQNTRQQFPQSTRQQFPQSTRQQFSQSTRQPFPQNTGQQFPQTLMQQQLTSTIRQHFPQDSQPLLQQNSIQEFELNKQQHPNRGPPFPIDNGIHAPKPVVRMNLSSLQEKEYSEYTQQPSSSHSHQSDVDVPGSRKNLSSAFRPFQRISPSSFDDQSECRDMFHAAHYNKNIANKDRFLIPIRDQNLDNMGLISNRVNVISENEYLPNISKEHKPIDTLETAERNLQLDRMKYAKKLAHMFDDASKQIIIPAPSKIKERKHHTHKASHFASLLNKAAEDACTFDTKSYLVQTMMGSNIQSTPDIQQQQNIGYQMLDQPVSNMVYPQNVQNVYQAMDPSQYLRNSPVNTADDGGTFFQITGVNSTEAQDDLLQQACIDAMYGKEHLNYEPSVDNKPQLQVNSENENRETSKQLLDIPSFTSEDTNLPPTTTIGKNEDHTAIKKPSIKLQTELLKYGNNRPEPIKESDVVCSMMRFPGDKDNVSMATGLTDKHINLCEQNEQNVLMSSDTKREENGLKANNSSRFEQTNTIDQALNNPTIENILSGEIPLGDGSIHDDINSLFDITEDFNKDFSNTGTKVTVNSSKDNLLENISTVNVERSIDFQDFLEFEILAQNQDFDFGGPTPENSCFESDNADKVYSNFITEFLNDAAVDNPVVPITIADTNLSIPVTNEHQNDTNCTIDQSTNDVSLMSYPDKSSNNCDASVKSFQDSPPNNTNNDKRSDDASVGSIHVKSNQNSYQSASGVSVRSLRDISASIMSFQEKCPNKSENTSVGSFQDNNACVKSSGDKSPNNSIHDLVSELGSSISLILSDILRNS